MEKGLGLDVGRAGDGEEVGLGAAKEEAEEEEDLGAEEEEELEDVILLSE